MITSGEMAITQTKKWIRDVVVGCNFCPFASRELKMDRIHYQVESNGEPGEAQAQLTLEFERLDENPGIETSFLIFTSGYASFREYLDLLEKAELLLEKLGYEGIYQLASFHPLYLFAGSKESDAANYSNRSVYPMLHFLREDSITKALKNYPEPGSIPLNNIQFARNKGLAYMKLLRDSCF